LWAAVWPTYPKWEPLKAMNDALIVVHDDDSDGVADRVTNRPGGRIVAAVVVAHVRRRNPAF
jgi:hypothetical protein